MSRMLYVSGCVQVLGLRLAENNLKVFTILEISVYDYRII